jgi:tripartite-type tricarboxylate transporter receptor subunit TctC
MRTRSRVIFHAALAAVSALTSTAALSQTGSYPVKPIRIVVPFSAGGPADITTRTLAPRLTELLGQSIIVDNRAGATGIIGAELVAKSPRRYTPADGDGERGGVNMVTY